MRTIWTVAATLVMLAQPAFAKTSKAPVTAPSFTLPSAHGTVVLDSLRGKVVLLDFWASWCVPCRQSFPWMNEMKRRYADRGLAVVAVNLDKTRDPAESFLEKLPAEFEVTFDPGGKTAESYRVKAMPTSFVISIDGTILMTRPGFDPKHASLVEAAIARALPR